MQFIFRTLLVAFAFCSISFPAQAGKYDVLWSEFDARILTSSEKRFLQAALAFEGHYNGLLDGKWGGISQRAIQNYSLEEFEKMPARWHMAMLAYTFFNLNDVDGWQIRYFKNLGMSFLFPEKANFRGEPSDIFANWHHSKNSLSYSLNIGDIARTRRLHNFTETQHASRSELYTVRKDGFAVTSATKLDGSILYTRSNLIGGVWSTIMLSAEKADADVLQAVASSISVGFRPILTFPDNGEIDRAIRLTLEFVDEDDAEVSAVTGVAPEEDRNVRSTGTGFYVTGDGKILTNEHVISGCSSIAVNGSAVTVVDASETFDLALLDSSPLTIPAFATFAANPAQLNSDVTVLGYPLNGLLGGLNVTRGAVSSQKGIQGDGIRMQISAPVQPGNSGGPVVNSTGAIVGVVVSKLNALYLADSIGDIPQNVNFAIRGEIAKLFLFQNGIHPVLEVGAAPISPVELAEKVGDFTVLVTCN